jgi:hypothetical protein
VHSLLQRRSTNILLSPRRHANDPCAECRIPLESRSAPFAIVCVFLTLHDAARLAEANHPHETLTRRASSGALTSRFSSLFRQGLGENSSHVWRLAKWFRVETARGVCEFVLRLFVNF